MVIRSSCFPAGVLLYYGDVILLYKLVNRKYAHTFKPCLSN